MDVIPPIKAARFEQLEPGDLFIYSSPRGSCFALKTEKPANHDNCLMAMLGPSFPYEINEAFLLPWEATTVISFGKNYSLILPSDPQAWFVSGNTRNPVCLAVSGEEVYLCMNAGHSPQRYLGWFVELKSGRLIEGKLPGIMAYTGTWEMALLNAKLPPRTILKYPAS